MLKNDIARTINFLISGCFYIASKLLCALSGFKLLKLCYYVIVQIVAWRYLILYIAYGLVLADFMSSNRVDNYYRTLAIIAFRVLIQIAIIFWRKASKLLERCKPTSNLLLNFCISGQSTDSLCLIIQTVKYNSNNMSLFKQRNASSKTWACMSVFVAVQHIFSRVTNGYKTNAGWMFSKFKTNQNICFWRLPFF